MLPNIVNENKNKRSPYEECDKSHGPAARPPSGHTTETQLRHKARPTLSCFPYSPHISLESLQNTLFLPSLTLDEGTHNMRKKIPQRGRWGGDFLLQMESSFKGLIVCVGSLGCIVCLLYILPLVNLLASLAKSSNFMKTIPSILVRYCNSLLKLITDRCFCDNQRISADLISSATRSALIRSVCVFFSTICITQLILGIPFPKSSSPEEPQILILS